MVNETGSVGGDEWCSVSCTCWPATFCTSIDSSLLGVPCAYAALLARPTMTHAASQSSVEVVN